MKKLFVLLPVVAVIAACSSTPKDDYEKRSFALETKREAHVDKSISKAPNWMSELPTSNTAVYANGTAVSSDMSMADYKAKLFAYGKICMAAGGKVSQQAKMFMQDTSDASNEVSELTIRSLCPGVDITGVETKEVNVLPKAVVSVAMPWWCCRLVKPICCNRARINCDLKNNLLFAATKRSKS